MISGGRVHIDYPLSTFAVDYRPPNMIADTVLPIIPVEKQSNIYTIFDQGPQWRLENDLRAPGTEARKIRLTISSANYFCPNYELMGSLTVEELENADPVVRMKLDQKRVAAVRLKIDLGREQRLADLMHASCGSRTVVASVWNDATNSDPIADINTAINNVLFSTGFRPNKMELSLRVWNQLRKHNQIINKAINPNVTGGATGYVTRQAVAAIFELDEVVVGEAFKNTAQEGLAMTLADVWSNSCLVYYAPRAAGLDEPCFAGQFRWSPLGAGMYVQRHAFDTKTKSQDVSVGHFTGEIAVGSSLGFALTGAAT